MKTVYLLKRVSEVLSVCIFLAGLTVLIGWILDIPILKSISPKFVTMKANTAICFILIGLSLWLSQEKRMASRLCRLIATLCSFIIFVTGFLTFTEYIFGWNLGIDQLLFKESAAAVLTSSPGRMALNTSVVFTVTGIVLFMIWSKSVFFQYLAQFLILLTGIIALLSFVGYLYGASLLYIGSRFSTAMALHTTVLFMTSCIGCLFAKPEQGLMKNVASDYFGGMMIRRLLPVIIIMPIIIGGLEILINKLAKYDDPDTAEALTGVLNILLISVCVYIFSIYLNRLDAKHRAVEKLLRQNEAKYKTLYQSSRDAIMMLAPPTWSFIAGNAATVELFRAKDEPDFISHAPWEVSPEYQPDGQPSLQKAKKMIEQAMMNGSNFFEWRHKRLDGEEFPATVLLTAIFLEGKQLLQATVRDICEEKLAEETLQKANWQLIEQNKLKSKIIDTVTHELRTPLCIFKNIISNALAGVMGEISPKLRSNLVMADEAVNRLAGIVSDFMDTAKIDAGKMQLHCKKFAIQTAIEKTVKAFCLLGEEKNIRLNIMAPEYPLIVDADYDRIIQVLTNLIGNAVKFTPNNGQIIIRVKDLDTEAAVEVEDNGIGIANNDIDKIFSRFVQIEQIVGSGQHGTGLGLSISKSLVDMHGGRIWVESTPGCGSNFCFVLPKLHELVVVDELSRNEKS
ncbi:MAG: PAS domain S-box protein [Planctomycetes bacterium]|nr:PAS domain S-box protein [Planctomycetota bacterium]